MAGHSKWANIKHRKERSDQKKGKIYSRLAKEIIVAVKHGGSDPKGNTKLRVAIQKARVWNLPNDIIERNIKKASQSDQQDFAEVTYELYGYGGVGIILEAMTDNKNRTASDIRTSISKCGGTLATPGSVMFNFSRNGIFRISKKKVLEEELFLFSTENNAEDFQVEEEDFIVITAPMDFEKMKEALENKKISIEECALQMIPKSWVMCSPEDEKLNQALIDSLENIDDVDEVFHNMELA
ncbi:MAG: YebC/PmpR family DNA-binding transcriptional regulator [Chlamydiota bacterium]